MTVYLQGAFTIQLKKYPQEMNISYEVSGLMEGLSLAAKTFLTS